MGDKMKYLLHYGGDVFELPERQKDVLDEIGDGTGTIKLNLGDGDWLTLVTGPGIPIALEERVVARTMIGRVR